MAPTQISQQLLIDQINLPVDNGRDTLPPLFLSRPWKKRVSRHPHIDQDGVSLPVEKQDEVSVPAAV